MSTLKFGGIVTKSKPLLTVTMAVPASLTRQGAGAWSQYSPAYSLITRSGDATITYTNKPKGQRARKANLCRHLTTALNYSGNTSQSYTIFNTSVNPPVEYMNFHLHNDSSVSHSTAVGVAKAAFSVPLKGQYLELNGLGLLNNAFVATKPNLTTMSLPNMLLEIGQLKMLFQLWKKNLSLAKNLAGGFLNYKFGWKPSMGDLRALIEATFLLKQRLAAFESAVGGVQHFQQKLLDETITKSGYFSAGFASRRCEWRGSLTRTATAHFAFRFMPILALTSLQKSLDVILDTLGVELNPRILWDAIPFSFVIDWFFDVGSFLDRFAIDTLELPCVLIDSYLQYKEGIVIESSLLDGYGLSQQTMVRSGGWHTSETWFQRMPLYPDLATFQGLGFKMPSFGQGVLGIALGTVLAKGAKH